MHDNSRLVFERYAARFFRPDLRVLEVGADARPTTLQQALGANAPREWLVAELASAYGGGGGGGGDTNVLTHIHAPGIDFPMPTEYEIPAPDESFDVVVAANVLEHVRKPWVWVRELARVCRADGVLVLVVPVSWPFHPAPVDCWRAYPDGMAALIDEIGFTVEVNTTDSLEPIVSRRWFPNTQYGWGRPQRRWNDVIDRAKAVVGWPTPRAVDTITVARKPA